jgi:hypothetical protein
MPASLRPLDLRRLFSESAPLRLGAELARAISRREWGLQPRGRVARFRPEALRPTSTQLILARLRPSRLRAPFRVEFAKALNFAWIPPEIPSYGPGERVRAGSVRRSIHRRSGFPTPPLRMSIDHNAARMKSSPRGCGQPSLHRPARPVPGGNSGASFNGGPGDSEAEHARLAREKRAARNGYSLLSFCHDDTPLSLSPDAKTETAGRPFRQLLGCCTSLFVR